MSCTGCNKTCVDHLPICGASCCKVLIFNVKFYPNSPMEKYYKTHGCKIERIDRDWAKVIVPMTCPHLTEIVTGKQIGK